MKNNYFQFKEFIVYHDRCALKVSTDSCLFGAWVAGKTGLTALHRPHLALDIGSGSSLLMLMLAQQFEGRIDGVEIDRESYEQAIENIQLCPWRERLHLFNFDIKLFNSAARYDLIFSNPPFFEGDLMSDNQGKNISKHNLSLDFQELIEIVLNLLEEDGRFAVLIPFHRLEYFEKLGITNNLFVAEKVLVRQTPRHGFFRVMLMMKRTAASVPLVSEMSIKDDGGEYTTDFKRMLTPYYLYL